MTDDRVNPWIPLGAVLSTWQWGLVGSTPSTERTGDLLSDERWLARVGLNREDGDSPDRAAEILDGLSIDEWNEMMLDDIFIARRAGILTDDGPYGKRCAAVDYKKLRVVTSAPIDILPSGQEWKVGRCRCTIENGTFNRLTRVYSLTHNYHHCVSAIVGLLAMRSFAWFLNLAYWYNVTARTSNAPTRFLMWLEEIVIED